MTGFSGTKATMHLLPLEIKMLDLRSQSHTNALVLGYLLRTSEVELLPPRLGSTDAEHVLMAAVKCEPEVRVVLACGAAILEQSNRQVVEVWLDFTDPTHVMQQFSFRKKNYRFWAAQVVWSLCRRHHSSNNLICARSTWIR
jgi:hypothetical protein